MLAFSYIPCDNDRPLLLKEGCRRRGGPADGCKLLRLGTEYLFGAPRNSLKEVDEGSSPPCIMDSLSHSTAPMHHAPLFLLALLCASTAIAQTPSVELNDDLIIAGTGDNLVCTNTTPLNNSTTAFSCTAFGARVSTLEAAPADFNGDGYTDVALANVGARDQLCFGSASGAMTCSDIGETVADSRAIAVADWDLDGDLDLIIGYGDDSAPRLCESSGGPTPTFGCTGLVGAALVLDVYDVQIGDVDGDAIPDAVFARPNSNQKVCYGTPGDSDAATCETLTTAVGFFDAALSDFDDDGDLDVALAGGGDRWCRNDGAPTDGSAARVAFECFGLSGSRGRGRAVVAADMNGDGRTDLSIGRTNSGEENTVCLNTPSAASGFTCRALPNQRNNTNAAAVADFNHDGRPDVVWGNVGNPSRLCSQSGSDNYSCRNLGSNTNATRAMAVGNFAGEPSGAIVSGLPVSGNAIYLTSAASDSVCAISADGTAAACTEFVGQAIVEERFKTAATSSSLGGFVADLDGDGRDDVVIAGAGRREICAQNTTGFFCFFPDDDSFRDGAINTDVAAADFDGDGILDPIFVARNAQTRLCLTDGRGFFASYTCVNVGGSFLSGEATGIVTGDFDGNGLPDFAVSSDTRITVVAFNLGAVSIGKSANSPVFSIITLTDSPATGTRGIAAGDLDGDGDLDLAFATVGSDVLGCRNEGGRTFTCDIRSADTYTRNGLSVAIGDIGSDGAMDIFVGDAAGAIRFTPDPNDADNYFYSASLGAGGPGTVSVAIADLNGDGVNDWMSADSLGTSKACIIGTNGRSTCRTLPIASGSTTLLLGTFDGSGAVSTDAPDPIAVSPSGITLRTFPNPARGSATVEVVSERTERVTVTVYDVLGRRVDVLHEGAVVSGQALQLRTPDLAPGTYLLRVTSAESSVVRPFVVVR